MQSYIARQPIFTPSRDVFGYELLFREGPENVFSGTDGDLASASVVADALHLHDLNTLGGGGKCFINVTSRIILDELYVTLPPEQVVLELLETIEPNPEILAACQKCREAGYSLALDDYVLEEKFAPVLRLIDILKVDFADTTAEQQALVAQQARTCNFELLAEKVETYEEFRAAKNQGYRYFQGFFFCKPEMLSKKSIAPLNLSYMQLLQQISEPTLDHKKLDEVISRDLALSYKLLRYLNSGAFRFRSEITSIRRALALLGDEPLRKWASLMVLGIVGESKPQELLNVSMVRAKLCERIMIESGDEAGSPNGFMVGMFSVLAAMLDQPLEDLLKTICLPELISATLRGEQTPLRPVLDLTLALEAANWQQVTSCMAELGLQEQQIGAAYIESVKWAAEQTKVIAAPAKKQAA